MKPATVVLLGLALLALIAWDARLARGEREARTDGIVRELVPEEVQRASTVAALSLTIEGGARRLTFLRNQGVWRCREAFGAIAHEGRIAALFRSVVDAQGVVRTRTPERAADYGLGAENVLVFGAHGKGVLSEEDEDLLFAVDVGSVAGPGRSFARPAGTVAIWEIDSDPRELVIPSETHALPPLLDERVLAGPWPEAASGFRTIFVDWSDGTSLEVAERAPDDAAPDLPRWVVVTEEGELPALPYRVGGFTAFCLRVPYRGVGDPRRRAAFRLDPPFARVTLAPAEGAPLELFLSAPDMVLGVSYAYNARTNMLVQISTEHARLFLPDTTMLTDPNQGNPWEIWLR